MAFFKSIRFTITLLCFVSVTAISSSVTWSQPGKITYLAIGQLNDYAYFQLSSPKVGGCDGRFYMLNHIQTENGKAMLTMLLSYEAQQKNILVHTNGNCLTEYQNAEVNSFKSEGDNLNY